MRTRLSQEAKEFIRKNASLMKDKDIAAKLTELTGMKVGVQLVRKTRQTMGLKKKPGRGVCELEQKKVPTSVDEGAVPVKEDDLSKLPF